MQNLIFLIAVALVSLPGLSAAQTKSPSTRASQVWESPTAPKWRNHENVPGDYDTGQALCDARAAVINWQSALQFNAIGDHRGECIFDRGYEQIPMAYPWLGQTCRSKGFEMRDWLERVPINDGLTYQYYGPNQWCAGPKCVRASSIAECGKSVKALQDVPKAATDPTDLFHKTHICIAEGGCNMRCTLDNCDWLTKVIPDFAYPYLQKAGAWSRVEAECLTSSANLLSAGIGMLNCADNMAQYHIEVDLRAALIQHGCGTQSDWDRIFTVIDSCSTKNLPQNFAWIGSAGVAFYRNKVRRQCIAARTTAGVPVEINDDIKGLTCKP